MKAEIASYARELEVVDMPEVTMTVPSVKYNVVILGDQTKETAMRLLQLHSKRPTTLLSTST